eukprot:TRINITY_DN5447_c0_g2_i1.p1 TRINITY_DN5447_c0_g2~~TRINITY_DN5447_c0_g2_i1.p1  ORF type:complete len:433 (-),score=73.90 TRINITY_DN5447_c0_g2_i1:65-1303(-)
MCIRDSFYEFFGKSQTKDAKDTSASKGSSLKSGAYQLFLIPKNYERICFLTFLLSLDAVLHSFLIIPLQILISPFVWLKQRNFGLPVQFKCAIAHVIIVISSYLILEKISLSAFYHFIKGQPFVKLFVVINTIEIFDRLMIFMGDYLLRTLWNRIETERSFLRIWLDLLVSTIYTTIHTMLLIVEFININVSLNSEMVSFFVILFANNMTELKITVFKKFDEKAMQNQVFYDCVERFQKFLHVFLMLTNPKSLNEDFGWKLFFLACAEYGIDWLKIIFLTKINNLTPEVYKGFLNGLREFSFAARYVDKSGDIETIRKHSTLDIKDIAMIESKVPHTINKIITRYYFLLLPHLVIIIKILLPLLQRESLQTLLVYVLSVILLKVIVGFIIFSEQNRSMLVKALRLRKDASPS